MLTPPEVDAWSFSLRSTVPDGLWVDGPDIRCARDGGEPVAAVEDVPMPGRHNLENALAALCMMRAGGFDWQRTLDGLRSFKGVEHRIEFVTTVQGVRYYNDSKSTNADSLEVALESFSDPVVLIAGGRGKGSDYGALRELVKERVKHLVTIGEDAALLEAAFGSEVPVSQAGDMASAVRKAADCASPGEIVLLSPACASFDMFDNFEHRGRVFKTCVQALATEKEDLR
jgi:UDP-N-acetylmuramoylalanine--D-glutamate ligase